MTTLPESPVLKAPEDSVEKQIYSIVDRYKEHIPRMNDRNRLSYALYKYVIGQGDEPAVAVKTNKLILEGITEAELAKSLAEDLKTIKS